MRWSGTSPLTYTYAWLRCDADGANCVATSATRATYPLANADSGHTLRVVVRAQNAAGAASATSAATAVVQSKKGGKTATRRTLQTRPQKRRVLLRLVYSLGRR